MNKHKKGLKSLQAELVAILLVLATAAVLLYKLLNPLFENAVKYYITKTNYYEKRIDNQYKSFTKMVAKEKLAATDFARYDEWIQNQQTIYTLLLIVRDNTIVYDSMGFYPEEDNGYTDYFMYYYDGKKDIVSFADGEATVYFYAYFNFQYYNFTNVAAIIISVVLFLLGFILLVQRKINYISTLEKDIKVLETGGLNHEITIKGNDELARLAKDLNSMRLVLKENIENEEEAVNANYSLVVSIAHDLRTPLTALLLYLDLTKKTDSKEQIYDYIDKSRTKAAQIKQMTDELFERFLISGKESPELMPPQSPKTIFEDTLSEFVAALEANGFSTDCNIEWPSYRLCVSENYINRIIDNILTNILKYADKEKPVFLNVSESKKEKGSLKISVSNAIGLPPEGAERNHVGVNNIRIMMDKMGGTCVVSNDGTNYSISLIFTEAKNTIL
ncbi:MAG: HAMP domain-containing histidine kinase [Lachnospiraceae bacterium]|nr:HAMP domain-containing histidine kinase [Lachnospiraceae bacterium]